MVIGVASGVVVFIVAAVVTVLCFIAKKKPKLFSFSHSRRDPNQNAEGAEVVKKMPEIGRFMKLPYSSERSSLAHYFPLKLEGLTGLILITVAANFR